MVPPANRSGLRRTDCGQELLTCFGKQTRIVDGDEPRPLGERQGGATRKPRFHLPGIFAAAPLEPGGQDRGACVNVDKLGERITFERSRCMLTRPVDYDRHPAREPRIYLTAVALMQPETYQML
jgi:hypothetical protein